MLLAYRPIPLPAMSNVNANPNSDNTVVIRQLSSADANDVADYRTIRLAALKDAPDAFGSTYEAEVGLSTEAFAERLATTIVLGAYAGTGSDARIVGMVGFKQQTIAKLAHKGFLWGFYVAPAARGRSAWLRAPWPRRARQSSDHQQFFIVEIGAAKWLRIRHHDGGGIEERHHRIDLGVTGGLLRRPGQSVLLRSRSVSPTPSSDQPTVLWRRYAPEPAPAVCCRRIPPAV